MYEKSASQSGKVKQEAGKLAMVPSASFIISNALLFLFPVMPLFSKWVVAALLHLILVLLFLERRCLVVDVLDGGHGKFGLLGPERRQERKTVRRPRGTYSPDE